MNKPNCNHDYKDLVLHYYGELSVVQSKETDALLRQCPDCAAYYASLLEMEMIVPRSASVEPDETVMSAIRTVTSRRLKERAGKAVRRPRLRSRVRVGLGWGRVNWLGSGWARASVVTAVLAFTFFLGRVSMQSSPGTLPDADSMIADISDLVFDPETGNVNVEYRTLGAGMVSGSMNDVRIRSLVGQALSNADDPATRLRAVKMLNAVEPVTNQPDGALILALSGIVQEDPNDGMKLQALTALRKLHNATAVSAELRDILMGVLDFSPNSALRIEALKILTESELARQDLNRVLARAAMDENSFIRFRAREELENLSETVALEQLN